jgi:hypothetical protein
MPSIVLCKSFPHDPSATPGSPLAQRSLKEQTKSPLARTLSGRDQENAAATANSPVQRNRKTKSSRKAKAAKQLKQEKINAETIFEPREDIAKLSNTDDVKLDAGEDRDNETSNKPLAQTKYERIAELCAHVETLKAKNTALKAAPQVKRIQSLLAEVDRLKAVRAGLIANNELTAKIHEANLAMEAKAGEETNTEDTASDEDTIADDTVSEDGSSDDPSDEDLHIVRTAEIYSLISSMDLEETWTTESIQCLVEHALRGCTWCWSTHQQSGAEAGGADATVDEADAESTTSAVENHHSLFAAFCKQLSSGIKINKQPSAKTRSLQRRTLSMDGSSLYCGNSFFGKNNDKKIKLSEVESVRRMTDKELMDKYGKANKKFSNRFLVVHPNKTLELQPGDGWRATAGECDRLVYMLNQLVTQEKDKAGAARFEAEELKAAAAAATAIEAAAAAEAAKDAEYEMVESATEGGVVQCAVEVKGGCHDQKNVMLEELMQKASDKTANAGADTEASAAVVAVAADFVAAVTQPQENNSCSMEDAELVEVTEYAAQLAADVAAAEALESFADAEVVSPVPADIIAAEATAADTAVETTEDVAMSKSMKKRLKKKAYLAKKKRPKQL